MSYTKKVVCLANSRKHGESCFAGKEVGDQGYGNWIRPVSARDSEGISVKEQSFPGGGYPKLLDVVAVPMLEPRPVGHQQENHLIDAGKPWKKIQSIGHDELPALLDDVPGPLWINHGGNNDRIPISDARKLNYSLLLIKPESLNVIVQWGDQYAGHRQVRALFRHNNINYNLVVTDPLFEEQYKYTAYSDHKKDGGDLPREYAVAADRTCLCVSLAEELSGNAYKLVAAVIGSTD